MKEVIKIIGEVRLQHDKQGNVIFPVTHISALFYNDGENLETKEQRRNDTMDAFEVYEPYDPDEPYIPLNKVYYRGSTFCNQLACTGIAPNPLGHNVNWLMVAEKGSDGYASMSKYTYVAATDGVTHIVHNLQYDPLHDTMMVYYGQFKSELEKDDNYTENADNLSIDLIGWSLKEGDKVYFRISNNLNEGTIEEKIQNGIDTKTALDESITLADETKDNLEAAIANGQIGDLTKDYVVTDSTYGNGVPAGRTYSVDYIRSRQDFLYADFYRGLRRGVLKVLCAIGDSLTYGHDVYSLDKRAADPTTLPDGSHHTFTRASKTYPEALQEYLQSIFGSDKITVLNRGYSGDGTERAYNRWITPSGANASIISLGINDAINSNIEYMGDLNEYLKWYEKLIVREILRGSAVIILTPTKLRTSNVDVDTFSNALFLLGDKYNCPVVNIDEFTANYSQSIHSDGTHFNGIGYTDLGARIASLFIGEGVHHPRNVAGGSKLLTREQIDNCKLAGGAIYDNSAGTSTPDEQIANQGIIARLSAVGDKIIYSFYVDTEDLICIPTFYLSATGRNVNVKLDFGIDQPDYALDVSLYKTLGSYSDKPLSLINIAATDSNYFNNSTVVKLSDVNNYIHIATRGWHTLLVELQTGGSSGSCVFNGLEFMEYKTMKAMTDGLLNGGNLLTHNGRYVAQTHVNLSDTNDVTTTTINYTTLLAALNLANPVQYWRGMPVKLIVYNWDNSSLEYLITLGDKVSNTGFKFYATPQRTNFVTTPTERTISDVSFNKDTNLLTITWAGTTTRPTTFIITI